MTPYEVHVSNKVAAVETIIINHYCSHDGLYSERLGYLEV